MIAAGTEEQAVTFAGCIPMVVSDIADDLGLQLKPAMAFNYAVNRASDEGYDDNDFIHLIHTSDIFEQEKWMEANKCCNTIESV